MNIRDKIDLADYYKDKHILVLGAAGMMGMNLWPKLEDMGARVTKVYHKYIPTYPRGRDIDNWSNYINLVNVYWSNYDIVFNCAGHVGGAGTILSNSSEMIHNNLNTTSEYIHKAVEAKCGKFVFISSSYVYPDTVSPATEDLGFFDDPPNVHYGLGWVKRYLETLCIHHHNTSDTSFVVVRPTNLYGPWDNYNLETCHAIPALIRKFIEAKPGANIEVWGDGSEGRNFTYIDDFVDGLLVATRERVNPYAINLCHDVKESIHAVVSNLQAITDRVLNKRIGYFFNKDKPTVVKNRLCSAGVFRELYSYECATPLSVGLEKTLQWLVNAKLEGLRIRG